MAAVININFIIFLNKIILKNTLNVCHDCLNIGIVFDLSQFEYLLDSLEFKHMPDSFIYLTKTNSTLSEQHAQSLIKKNFKTIEKLYNQSYTVDCRVKIH